MGWYNSTKIGQIFERAIARKNLHYSTVGSDNQSFRPGGTIEKPRVTGSRPSGTGETGGSEPSAEALGYCLKSLTGLGFGTPDFAPS